MVKKLSKQELQKEKEYWTTYFLNLFSKYDTIYTLITKTSKTGMSRRLKLFVPICDEGEPKILDITYGVSIILDLPYNSDGVLITGVGADVGFEVVYNLSYKLYYGDGYKLKQKWLC